MLKRFAVLVALIGLVGGLFLPALASAQSAPPSSIIMKLVAGLTDQAQVDVIATNGGILRSSIPALRLYVIGVPAAEIADTLARYQADPRVERAEENKVRLSESVPGDPLYPDQWALPRIAWDQVFGTVTPTGIAKVAILDTGVDALHPELAGVLVPGTSILDSSGGTTDPSGHGTWLAGIVAAQTGGTSPDGIAGVAYDGVRIMPVTVLNASGEGLDSDVIAGVIWAVDHGADVILMAFSNPGFSPALQEAIDYAWSRGVVLVASAGNSALSTPAFPAGDRGVMGVAATDQNDAQASFSNEGQAVFIAAPGTDIPTTSSGDAYAVISGTSAAAAHVAGLAAFMKAVDPTLSNGVIVFRIASTADPAGTQIQTGNGRINMARALASTATESIQPAGADPLAEGGPFVGPYRADNHTLSVSCTSPVPVNTPSQCTATVGSGSGGQPASGRTITFSGGTGTFSPTTCTSAGNNTTASCSVQFTPTTVANHTITASVAFSAAGHSTSNTATVTATATNAAPAIARNNASVTVNEGATASNTGTWSDANSGDTVTLSASVGSVSKAGTNAAGTWSWSFATTDGPAQSQTVTITANDGNGETATATFSLTVNNVAPTAMLSNNGPVNEGSSATISFTNQFDPSSADTSAGFHYAFSCTNGDLSAATYAGSGTGASTSCPFDDGPTKIVKARIIDKDGGSTEYTTTVTVNNVPPTATLSNNGPVNEGSAATISFGNQFDPSSVDTTAGFHYAFSCTNGDLSAATYAGSGTGASTSCPFDDGPATRIVKARIIDKDGGFTEYTTTVTVNNVPPTATLSNNGPVNEGSAATISFSNQFDPSSADTGAGFRYAFSCTNGDLSGATYAGSGTGASTPCTFNDGPATQTVKARIIDKDGGFTEYTTTVTVNNVPPTATLSNNGPVNEGSAATISFSNQFDPSSVDTAAGFRYAFSCTNGDLSGATYAGSGASASIPCTFDDGPATQTVKARIIDKDGGFTEYTTTVTVNNVPPTITAVTPSPTSVLVGETVTFTGTATDPSSADMTVGLRWSWNGGVTFGVPHTNTFASSYGVCGSYTVAALAQDKDGGVSTSFPSTAVTVWNGNFLEPLREGTSNLVQKGRVVPVKINFGCGGHRSGLAPAIQLLNGDFVSSAGTESASNYIDTLSVSNADTTGVMREVDSKYMYNLAIPNNSMWGAGKPLTIRVSPFGNGTSPVMYILLEIRK